VNRALPFAVRIAACQTPPGLRGCAGTVVGPIDLAVVLNAVLCVFLFRIAPWHLEKLQWMFRHYAACLSDSISELSSSAFGFTTQNLGR